MTRLKNWIHLLLYDSYGVGICRIPLFLHYLEKMEDFHVNLIHYTFGFVHMFFCYQHLILKFIYFLL